MSLINKIFHNDTPPMSSHILGGLLRMYFIGEVGKSTTLNRIETMLTNNNSGTAYTLTTTEKDQIDEFKAQYDGKSTDAEKAEYLSVLESTMILAEHGLGTYLSKPQFKNVNGLTTDP